MPFDTAISLAGKEGICFINNMDALYTAALELAARQGWSSMDRAMLAHKAGLSADDLAALVPTQKDLRRLIHKTLDQKTAATALFEGSVKDRLLDIIMARLDLMQAHRAGFLALLQDVLHNPASMLSVLPDVRESLRMMYAKAGIDKTDAPHQQLPIVLGWLLILRTWMRDDSGDLAATMATADRVVSRALRFIGTA